MVSLSHLQSLLSISSFLQIPLNLITIASSHHKGVIVMPKKYPLEFKKQAIRRYEKGESIPALCQELHVSQSTFYHWRNQYRSIQTSAHTYTPAEFDTVFTLPLICFAISNNSEYSPYSSIIDGSLSKFS